MGFLALAIGNAYRSVLSTAIPEMVYPINSSNSNSIDSCPSNEPVSITNQTFSTDKLFHWDEYTQVKIFIQVNVLLNL